MPYFTLYDTVSSLLTNLVSVTKNTYMVDLSKWLHLYLRPPQDFRRTVSGERKIYYVLYNLASQNVYWQKREFSFHNWLSTTHKEA